MLWDDPEFWGPKGLGCSRCHDYPPLIRLPFGGLCERCLLQTFVGFTIDRLIEWLGRQRGVYVRQGKRRSAIDAWKRGDDRLRTEYQQEYGVDVIG